MIFDTKTLIRVLYNNFKLLLFASIISSTGFALPITNSCNNFKNFEIKTSLLTRSQDSAFLTPLFLDVDSVRYKVYLSDEVFLFLGEVLEVIKNKALHSSQVDWGQLEEQVYKRSNFAIYTFQAYPAIEYALSQLKEKKRHSRFISLKEDDYKKHREQQDLEYIEDIEGKLITDEIAYINVPCIRTMNLNYVEQIQKLIRQCDSKKVQKWIIDLRNNKGGSCWPMLLALGPLWNGTILGFFGKENEPNETWFHDSGEVGIKELKVCLKISNPYTLKNLNPYIAILIGNNTMSAGEVVSVAFRGQERVRHFGHSTGGYTTGVVSHPISNEVILALAESYYYDRHKNIYTNGMSPDEIIIEEGDQDTTLSRAVEWLNSQ